MPAPRFAVRPAQRPSPYASRLPSRRDLPGPRRGRHYQDGGPLMATPEVAIPPPDDLKGIKDAYEYGFHDSEKDYAFKAKKGLSRQVVEEISEFKNEPAWMREFRLK